jgi:hypothetical protein
VFTFHNIALHHSVALTYHSIRHLRDVHSTSGSVHTNEAHKNNNDNRTTQTHIGLNKTTQKTRKPQEENSEGKDKELCSQRNLFYCERRKCNNIKIY